MSKRFWILYSVNGAIIILALLMPGIELLVGDSSSDKLLIGYYAVTMFISLTFCVSFLALNVYGAFKHKAYRIRYYTVIILLLIWIFWGMYQLVFAIIHDIAI